jgi:hypothetical protein
MGDLFEKNSTGEGLPDIRKGLDLTKEQKEYSDEMSKRVREQYPSMTSDQKKASREFFIEKIISVGFNAGMGNSKDKLNPANLNYNIAVDSAFTLLNLMRSQLPEEILREAEKEIEDALNNNETLKRLADGGKVFESSPTKNPFGMPTFEEWRAKKAKERTSRLKTSREERKAQKTEEERMRELEEEIEKVK